MSRVYDSWEKLVGAVLKREELRQIALCESFSSSSSADISSRFSFDSAPEDVPHDFLGSSSHPAKTKLVLEILIHSDRDKRKVMKAVSKLSGVESIAMDIIENKLTVVGDADPIQVVVKVKNYCRTEILSLGRAEDP